MNQPSENVETVFEAALALESDAERAAYLNQACSDAALRREVEALLEAYRNPDSLFNEETVLGPTPLSEGPGTRIGRYKLLQQIGEGGMGVVYMAEQEEPVRRRVALKIIKLGMDTRSVVARFEAERQALALMDHPNIARVLDGGATDTGRPYFVMELVQGVPITGFCDKNKLPARERMRLFIQVCQAIQSAHQKGIIHRDIKPSNVLVTLHHGEPMPKVIDFGIAKATNQKLTEKTLFTNYATMIGTPAYMSPEQAEMTSMDVDTRTDVYSLGVLLYELLTGSTPFPEKRLRSLGYGEMQRVIVDEVPQRPSTRLSTMGDELKTVVAKNRGGELTGLSQLLRGDLDWVVMRCLEKDRRRRYDTPNELVADIERHLKNEPVVARPPTLIYRAQKLVRRNKLAFGAASAVALTLLAGLSLSTWAFLSEAAHRRKAVAAQASEEVQRKDAVAQRNVAVEQRKLADMQLALQAWEEGDLRRADDLIEASRPAAGQAPAFEWRYLKQLCQDQSIETLGHTYRAALFYDSNLLLLNDEKTLTLYDVARRTERMVLEDQDGISNHALCSGNTNLLATVTDDFRIKVWDLTTRRLRKEFEGHPRAKINSITFSPDGRWLASASQDKSVKLWDVESNSTKPTRTVYQYSGWARSVVFSPDGRHLFTSGSETMIRTWDVATGSEEGVPLEGHTDSVHKLALSPDGGRLASGSSEHIVIIWDVISRKPLTRLFGHSGGIRALAFSPGGRMLASGGHDQIIRLWDLNNERATVLFRGHQDTVSWLSFSPDGQLLLSRDQSGLFKLWRTTPGLEGNVLIGSPEGLNDVALSPDGRFLASVTEQSFAVNLWDLTTGSRIILTGHSNSVMCAVFSSDGRILATGSHDQTVRLWDVSERKAVATLTNGFPVGSLAFSPDGHTLIAGGSALNILVEGRAGLQFWDVPSRRATGTIPGDAADIVEVALSGDGTLLATGHRERDVSLWEAQTRRFLHRFRSGFPVMSLTFSPTEPLLVAGDWSGNIAFYDTTAMEKLGPSLKAHTFMANGLAFSRDGRTLVSYGDGAVGLKLWNVATRQLGLTLKGHQGWVSGIAFSQDGNLMASSCSDSTVRLWRAAALEEAVAPARVEKRSN